MTQKEKEKASKAAVKKQNKPKPSKEDVAGHPFEMYPRHGDPNFAGKLMALKEYQTFRIPDMPVIRTQDAFDTYTKKVCTSFDKLHQHFVEHYLSSRSPYKSILLFHSLGVGKTCTAITVAEAMLTGHTANEEPRIIVVASGTLQDSFEDELRGECTDGVYQRLGHGDPKRIANLVKSRYKFLTYDGIITYAAQFGGTIHGKTIIIDEAHNLKDDNNKKNKEYAVELEKLLLKSAQAAAKHGKPANRLILLSATPMYDKPTEIMGLFDLLVRNDGSMLSDLPGSVTEGEMFDGDDILTPKARAFIQRLAGEYVSYIKSNNPFAFAQRLSPLASGIPIIEDAWAAPLADGIVPTPAGDLQVVSQKDVQSMNITYPPKLGADSAVIQKRGKGKGKGKGKSISEHIELEEGEGEEVAPKGGFWRMFNRRNAEHFSVTYSDGNADALMPVPGKLGRIAAKILRICDLIRESEGIVVVYSQYVWSGVLPLAIALEHMGMQRYGSPNILPKASVIDSPVAPGTSYAIFSADKDVVRSSNFIQECRKVINSPKNHNGKIVKVVLLTQVAGEGISLKNVREVHIVEPWWNMNRIDQVIGRGIRTCSHVDLPLPRRNVTVFLHAIDHENSADVNRYKNFVVKKIAQIKQVEEVVRSSALDCSLMRNMNYYPRSNFPFSVIMTSSRGIDMPVRFGNDANTNFQCAADAADPATFAATLSEDAYNHVIPLGAKRIVKALRDVRFITLDALEQAVGLERNIFNAALTTVLFPNVPIQGHRVYLHLNGVSVQPDALKAADTSVGLKVRLPSKGELKKTKEDNSEVTKMLDSIVVHKQSPWIIAFSFYYIYVNESNWDTVAQTILSASEYHELAYLMRKHGLFVFADELSRGSVKKPVGYVNIFDTNENAFAVTMHDAGTGAFRMATDNETQLLKDKRRRTWTHEDLPVIKHQVGMIVPEKKGSAASINIFKVVIPSKNAGKNTGKVCTSFHQPQLVAMLEEAKARTSPSPPKKQSKDEICISLGCELMRADRIFVYPQWKPTK